MPVKPIGAAAEYVARTFNGMVTETEDVQSIGVTQSEIFGNDPERVSILLVNLSANTMYVGFDPAVSSARGILLASNGGHYSSDIIKDFMLPIRAMHVLSVGAASNLFVLTMTRYKQLSEGVA